MKDQIHLIPSSKPHLFTIQLNLEFETRYIGKLDTREQGSLLISRSEKHLFRKTNSLGINHALLSAENIKFKNILIRYNGKKYYSTREYYLKKGKPFQFSSKGFELQYFVPLDELNINTVKRFESLYCIQEDLFNSYKEVSNG